MLLKDFWNKIWHNKTKYRLKKKRKSIWELEVIQMLYSSMEVTFLIFFISFWFSFVNYSNYHYFLGFCSSFNLLLFINYKKKVCVEPLCMVSEFVANGSLLDQLKVKTLDSLFFQKLIDLCCKKKRKMEHRYANITWVSWKILQMVIKYYFNPNRKNVFSIHQKIKNIIIRIN